MRRVGLMGLCCMAACFSESEPEMNSASGSTSGSTTGTVDSASTTSTTTEASTSDAEDDTGSSSGASLASSSSSSTGEPLGDCEDRITLLFDNPSVEAELNDLTFPVTLGAEQVDYANYLPENVTVQDRNEQRIPHSVDIWRPGGASVLWVRAPRIDAEHDRIFVCFGPPPPPPPNVWGPEALGVWNFGDPDRGPGRLGVIPDDSLRGNHAVLGTTPNPAPQSVDSPLGEALIFQRLGNFAEVANAVSLTPEASFTMEAVVRRNSSTPEWQTILDKASAYNMRVVDGMNEAGAEVFFSDQTNIAERVPELMPNQRTYIAVVFDQNAGTLTVCTNGTTCEVSTAPTTTVNEVGTPLDIGRGDIEIDHLRLTSVARSPQWISAAGRGFAGGLLVQAD